jgi:hypothetical protein
MGKGNRVSFGSVQRHPYPLQCSAWLLPCGSWHQFSTGLLFGVDAARAWWSSVLLSTTFTIELSHQWRRVAFSRGSAFRDSLLDPGQVLG